MLYKTLGAHQPTVLSFLQNMIAISCSNTSDQGLNPDRPTFVIGSPTCAIPAHTHCHYKIAWSINPYMMLGNSQIQEAIKQHSLLEKVIIESRANLIRLPFICEAYDSVFVKDNAFVFQTQQKRYALLSKFQNSERQIEQTHRVAHYESLNFGVVYPDEDFQIEGGDIVADSKEGCLFVGYGIRTQLESIRFLTRLGFQTIALELVDPFFYHLDTALFVLEDGTAVAYKNAFSDSSWKKLRTCPSIQKVIEISREEALAFGCNLLQIGRRIIIGSFLPKLMEQFERLGYSPDLIPQSQFQRAGGSVACLVTRIRSLPRKMLPIDQNLLNVSLAV